MNEIKEMWERFHEKQTILHLSNNSLGIILTYLNIVEEFKTAENILEIGVGTAKCTKDMYSAGKNITCVDISENALIKARSYADYVYLNTQMDYLPSGEFDLAISFCVIQHITESEFVFHLKETIRSLKSDGIFAFQFAYDYDDIENDLTYHDITTVDAGRCGKSLKRVTELVENNNGEVLWVSLPVKYQILGWHSMKIRRTD